MFNQMLLEVGTWTVRQVFTEMTKARPRGEPPPAGPPPILADLTIDKDEGCPYCAASKRLWVAAHFLYYVHTKPGPELPELYKKLAITELVEAHVALLTPEVMASPAGLEMLQGVADLLVSNEAPEPMSRRCLTLAEAGATLAEGRNRPKEE